MPAKSIIKQGAKDAILRDEGPDVMQRGLTLSAEFDISNKRERLRAVLIFARDRYKAAE